MMNIYEAYCNKYRLSHTMNQQEFEHYFLPNNEMIFTYVITNEQGEINDAIMSLAMIDNLAKSSIQTAIDDVCNPQSMISTSVIQLVNYIKLDKFVIKNKSNRNFMLLVKSIIDYAHSTDKKVILEGVETYEDLTLAKQLTCDFVQGFYYRDRFKNVS